MPTLDSDCELIFAKSVLAHQMTPQLPEIPSHSSIEYGSRVYATRLLGWQFDKAACVGNGSAQSR